MQQQMNQGMQNTSETIPTQMNHGGHEVFDIHEYLSGTIGALDHLLMYEQHIKDPELMGILNRHRQFITDTYNITVECFKSGQDPSHPTTSYKMNQSNDVKYGLTPSKPKSPNNNVSALTDQCISSLMLSCSKSLASTTTMVAGECTNPVVRRVLQDSIPNYLEMAYEVFLYQNKHGYYQVLQQPKAIGRI